MSVSFCLSSPLEPSCALSSAALVACEELSDSQGALPRTWCAGRTQEQDKEKQSYGHDCQNSETLLEGEQGSTWLRHELTCISLYPVHFRLTVSVFQNSHAIFHSRFWVIS